MRWFETVFLKSFDADGSTKRISDKQFNVFVLNLNNYLYKEEDTYNTIMTEYHFNDLIIILQDSLVGFGKNKWTEKYVTIRKARRKAR